jgi:xylan 1,4-beta-xylosidase
MHRSGEIIDLHNTGVQPHRRFHPAHAAEPAPMTTLFTCKLDAAPTALKQPWQHCVGSCHAPTALRADWQGQLRQVREDLGFRHVRFHGLLCDDMGTLICQSEQLLYSFFNIDQIFDFLLSIGMKPLVELSFMPATLSSGGTTVFHYRANVTPPKDYRQWGDLIFKLVGHWVERYGIDEVAQWPLEVWNEPNLEAFWTGGKDAYFTLYKTTAEAIKRVDPRLQVGGPATAQNAWVPEFLEYCTANKLPADFVSTHFYPTDAFGEIGADTVTQLEHAPLGVMRERALQARAAAGPLPLYYTEWNVTSNPRDPLHDQSFAAALAVRIAMSVDDVVDAYSYWTFSDIFEENYFPSVPFHGGFGLLNLHGIAKPIYRAFQWMRQLGDTRFATTGAHDTVAVWVGEARANAGAMTSALLINQAMPRHAIAAEPVQLRLTGMGERQPSAVRLSRIDEEHCNPARAWQEMGQPEYLSAQAVESIRAASSAAPLALPFSVDQGALVVDLVLPPQSLALITIDWHGR